MYVSYICVYARMQSVCMPMYALDIIINSLSVGTNEPNKLHKEERNLIKLMLVETINSKHSPDQAEANETYGSQDVLLTRTTDGSLCLCMNG
jgi:hypothetical protein